METESIDKLFLELSQITKATTAKEQELLDILAAIIRNRDEEHLDNSKFPYNLAVHAVMKSLELTPHKNIKTSFIEPGIADFMRPPQKGA